MRAGHIVGVEPDVAAVRHPEGDLFILKVVFSNINIIAVAADVMERPALGRAGTVHLAAAVLPGIFAAQVAAFLHFLPDLGEIRVCRGEFEGVLDAPEVVDLSLHLFCQTGQGLAGPFHAGITVKILFCVLLRREGGIEGDRHLLAGIIVVDLAAFFSRGDGVAVGIQEFSVQPVFVLFFRVPDLPALEVIFVDIPLQDRLHDVAEVRTPLPDAGIQIFSGVKILEQGRGRVIGDFCTVRVVAEGNEGKFHRSARICSFAFPAVHGGSKASGPDSPDQVFKPGPECLLFLSGQKSGRPVLREICPVTELLGDDSGKAGIAAHEKLRRFCMPALQNRQKSLPCLCERIFFGLGVRNEPGSAGKDLADGTDH